MRLFLDENVPADLGRYLSERGHGVIPVRDVLGSGASDDVVATLADFRSAIVVTLDRTFASSCPARRLGSDGASLASAAPLRCREQRALQRVQEFIEEVEFEHELAQTRGDRRVIIEITESTFIIVR